MKASVVIPCYNECWTIREIVRRVMVQAPLLKEVILVDDGSTDGTRELIAGLLKQYERGPVPLRAILKEKNEGKGAALVRGFQEAAGDFVLVQDADLEYDPKDYAALLAPLQTGQADAVFGSRFAGGTRNALFFWHTIANRLLTLSCNIVSNLNLTDVWTGYKAFRTSLIRKIPLESRGFDFEPEVTIKLAKLGCRVVEVPCSYQGRGYAEGKKIGLKDAFIAVWAMFRTSLWGDLGPLAVGEQTLRIMARAGRYNRFIYEQYRRHLGPDVVELGAGVGNVSRFLLDRRTLLLTENDPDYVELLKRSFGDWGYVSVRPLDLNDEKAGADVEGKFDTAICFNVIEHVERDAEAVRGIARLLKPGGKAILIVPAHQALFGSLDEGLKHYRRYDKRGFSDLVKGAGLSVVEARYLNPIAVPGWWLNGKVLRRKVIPGFQLALFDKLTFLVRWTACPDLSFGLSLFVVAQKPPK